MENYIVYKHTNLINGKIYIGITCHGNNPNQRWKNGRGYQQNEKFFSDIIKYGWDNFSHEIIEKNLDKLEAIIKEQEYIQKYDCIKNGYNNSEGGNIPSKESRKKISQALKGIKREKKSINKQIKTKIENSGFATGFDPILSKNSKKVRCKETGDVFGSITEANNWSNTSKIYLCCKGERAHAGKHPETGIPLSWEYVEEETPITIRQTKKRKSKTIKKIQCIETQEIFENASKAYEKTKITISSILRVCHGERKTAGGYHWKFIEEE